MAKIIFLPDMKKRIENVLKSAYAAESQIQLAAETFNRLFSDPHTKNLEEVTTPRMA